MRLTKAMEVHKLWESSSDTWSMLLRSIAKPANSSFRQMVFPKNSIIWPNTNQILKYGRGEASKERWQRESELLGVWGRAAKTYQSQVIPTAVQGCYHHLLINNPYWAKKRDREDCVNPLSIPLSAVTWKYDILNCTLDIQTFKCPKQLHLMFLYSNKQVSIVWISPSPIQFNV